MPYKEPNYLVHVVRPNESLYNIASKYNVSVDYIKDKNGLSSDTIYPRQELII